MTDFEGRPTTDDRIRALHKKVDALHHWVGWLVLLSTITTGITLHTYFFR